MESNKWNDFYYKFKRRTKVTLYVAAVLWVAVITQIFVNRVFREELQITEAFIKSETAEMQSSLEIVAEYPAEVLSDEGKRELIYRLADVIGLTVDDDITVWEEETKSEFISGQLPRKKAKIVFQGKVPTQVKPEQAKQASTEIKVVSMVTEKNNEADMKHYIVIQLTVLKGIQSIDKYKDLLEEELTELGTANKQVTVKYEGMREGDLTSLQKSEIATLLVEELQGEIAIEYDEGDLYTVYAYTGMINEYVTTLDNKINIQIAITYNELTDTTKITLATPVLNDSF